MMPVIRTRDSSPKRRRATGRVKTAANDSGQPASVAVILVAVTNASRVRKKLGFDGWGGALLSFVSGIKSASGGGRVSNFAWDTICLVFDAITLDQLKANFASVVGVSGAIDANNALPPFQFIAGAASGRDKIEALERAEQALADAKLCGHSLIDAGGTASRDGASVDLDRDLALAISRAELFMVYQPKVHVRQRTVSSAAALIRWQHPILGLVMPDAFIVLADESGEMRAITLWTGHLGPAKNGERRPRPAHFCQYLGRPVDRPCVYRCRLRPDPREFGRNRL